MKDERKLHGGQIVAQI